MCKTNKAYIETWLSCRQCSYVCSISPSNHLPTVPAVPAGRCHNQPHSKLCRGKCSAATRGCMQDGSTALQTSFEVSWVLLLPWTDWAKSYLWKVPGQVGLGGGRGLDQWEALNWQCDLRANKRPRNNIQELTSERQTHRQTLRLLNQL